MRIPLVVATLALLAAGCVDRGGWKPAPQVAPQQLSSAQSLAGTREDPTAWPAAQWWRAYGDPQLDTLVDEALADSPSLEIAEARLRAAQGQVVSAGAARLPTVNADASLTRQRYPEHDLYPPPLGGSWQTD